jgi:phosphatidate phosphatase APP1
LRKLKFQYLEQNAKDKYVKSIVSDIDDAPIVTAEQNKELAAINQEKKATLKAAKEKLAEMQNNIRTLAPMVEEGAFFSALLTKCSHLPRLPASKRGL